MAKDAQAALIRFNSFEKFTISSKPVMVDYIHAGVFVPVLSPHNQTARFTFSPLGNPATKLVYWDEEAWASEMVVSTASPGEKSSETRGRPDTSVPAIEGEGLDSKPKKRKAEANANAKPKKVGHFTQD